MDSPIAVDQSARIDEPATVEPSRHYVWYVVGLLTVVNFFNFMDRMALSVLMPLIKADLRLSDAQLGLLAGIAFALVYAVCAIPIARLADRGVRRDIIAIAMTVWSSLTVVCGLANNFWQLFLARVGVGGGEAGCSPPAVSILCDYVPYERRPGAFALHSFGATLGGTLGLALAGFLGATLGWRWTFAILGLAGIPVALLVRLTLREPVRGRLDRIDSRLPMSFRETMAFLLRCRTYVLIVIVAVMSGFINGVVQWWPTLYTRSFGLGLATAGGLVGLAVGGGTAMGVLAGGVLANKASSRGVQNPFLIAVVAVLLALPCAFAMLLAKDLRVSLSFLALWHLCTAVPLGLTAATVNSVVPARARATAYAIFIFAVTVIGGSGPVVVGILSDGLTGQFGEDALRYALMAPPCLLPLMAFVLWNVGRALPADLDKVGVTAGAI